MPGNWKGALAEIEKMTRQVDGSRLWASAFSFVEAASILTAPDEVGLGYWRNSVRLIWPNCEVEIFEHSVEVYRFDPAGTDIATVTFQPGDELPTSLRSLLETGLST